MINELEWEFHIYCSGDTRMSALRRGLSIL